MAEDDAKSGRQRVSAYLSLGSNLGDRLGRLREALERLGRLDGVRLERVSAVYETEPVGVKDQPPFLNLAARIETTLEPLQLLDAAKRIEREMGRRPGPRWGPRPVDIDILLHGAAVMETPRLTLPHPAMLGRAFVLVPLAEIAPDLVLPDGRTAGEHASQAEEGCVRHAVLPL